jgi:hypothetical protein
VAARGGSVILPLVMVARAQQSGGPVIGIEGLTVLPIERFVRYPPAIPPTQPGLQSAQSRRRIVQSRRRIMLGILKIKLIEAIRGLQHACATAVIRDDDGDDGDIATPKTCIDDDM